MTVLSRRPWRRLSLFVVIMLVVEFIDEFAYSTLEAARPLIRDAFTLTYVEIGLITTVPILVAILVEPVAGLFADSGRRRGLIVGGGMLFGLGLIVQGAAGTFAVFLLGATIQAPASGVFVNLAQASLMDDAPTRRENRMALWTFSGSLAVVTGPLLLTAALALGLDWRAFFAGTGVVSMALALVILRLPPNRALRSAEDDTDDSPVSLRQSLRDAIALLKQAAIWRWLLLLEFSDLMLDVMFGLLALYMVDVAGVSQTQAGIAIAVWTGVGLIGDFLLIPLLERVRGLTYLRFSAGMELILYPLFLLADAWMLQLGLLGVIGLFNAGWYAILQGKLYDALGEQSGAVLIVGNATGIITAVLPVVLGAIAQRYGLEAAMWCLLAGPIALLIGLPRHASTETVPSSDAPTSASR